jgi:DNA-binding response OmpR family regulator
MNILIAEDDLTSRTILRAMLGKWGFATVTASDGAEAWAILQRPEAPRLILLDWLMPGMDGVEICRRVRETGTDQPPYIILLTALGETNRVVEGLSAGADDYITKPYNQEELRARIEVGIRILTLQASLAQRVAELQAALDHVRKLQGILPICMHCHKIRNDQESWERIEKYITEHSEAQFSHSICPECLATHYPDFSPESPAKDRKA